MTENPSKRLPTMGTISLTEAQADALGAMMRGMKNRRRIVGTLSQIAAELKRLGPEWTEEAGAMHMGHGRWICMVSRLPSCEANPTVL